MNESTEVQNPQDKLLDAEPLRNARVQLVHATHARVNKVIIVRHLHRQCAYPVNKLYTSKYDRSVAAPFLRRLWLINPRRVCARVTVVVSCVCVCVSGHSSHSK